MAVTNGGMTLYTDNDTQQSWAGTDDLDIEVYEQGSGSESWAVAKSGIETGTLTLSADLSNSKYFTLLMKSDWANFYDYINAELESTANNKLNFLLATGKRLGGDSEISGDFKFSVMQLSEGTETGTYAPASHTLMRVIVDASNTGNIRSIVNHWIDCMYHGNGRTIGGTTASDKLFLESHTLDTITNDTYDGCSSIADAGLAFYTDIEITTTVGNSFGEKVTWFGKLTTDGVFKLLISGTVNFNGTNLIGNNCTIALDTLTATSFTMLGGGISNGGNIDFGSGQTIGNSLVIASSLRVKAATVLQGVTISNTTEATTGAYEMQNGTELNNALTDITISSYSGKTAIYIPATITGTITISGVVVDASGTDVYWAGTGGTLVINASNGTNLSSWNSAGGTVDIQNSVTLTLTGLPDGIEVRIRQGSHTLHHVQNTSGGSTSYGYNYSGDELVKVSFSGAGIIQSKYIKLTLGSSDQTVPVQFENDPSYL